MQRATTSAAIMQEVRTYLEESITIPKGCYITYHGERIRTAHNKQAWSSVGAAKNAFHHMISHITYRGSDSSQIMNALIESGELKFVSLDGKISETKPVIEQKGEDDGSGIQLD